MMIKDQGESKKEPSQPKSASVSYSIEEHAMRALQKYTLGNESGWKKINNFNMISSSVHNG